MHFGGNGKSATQNQRETASKYAPATLEATSTWAGPIRVAKLRVWADSDYRAQNVEWQRAFDEHVAYVNAVVGPMLGIKLAPEYRAWERHAPGAQLGDDLDALEAQDPGDDVAFVLGLTSSLSLASATFDEIGVAHLDSGHMMMRGHADLEERQMFERAFPQLGADERAMLLDARKSHKIASTLLHELAHSLGALHESAEDTVMSPMYSVKAAHVDDHNRGLMRIGLEERLAASASRDSQATAAKQLAALEQGWTGWVAAECTDEIQHLRAMTGGSAPAPSPRVDVVPATVYVPSPSHVAAAPSGAALVADAQQRAVERVTANDLHGAVVALAAVEPRLSHATPAVWIQLADAYSAIGAIGAAEAAVSKAGPGIDDHGIKAEMAQLRARYGIPEVGWAHHVDTLTDLEALAAVKRAMNQTNAKHFAEARQTIDAAEQRWPGLPGLAAVRCDLEYRQGSFAAAKRDCAKAGEQSSWALYLAGVIDLRSAATTKSGIAHLRAAIALDSELQAAWRALAAALDRSRQQTALAALLADYEKRFGVQLAY